MKQAKTTMTASLIDLPEWRAILNQTRGNETLAHQILALFAEELPDLCQVIEAALAKNEWSNAAKAVHKIHGSASFCGLSQLKSVCAALESQLRNQRSPETCVVDEFHKETNRLRQLLKAFVQPQ